MWDHAIKMTRLTGILFDVRVSEKSEIAGIEYEITFISACKHDSE